MVPSGHVVPEWRRIGVGATSSCRNDVKTSSSLRILYISCFVFRSLAFFTTLSHHIENSKIRGQTGVDLDGRLKLTVLSGPVLFINSNIFISGINTKSILYSNIMLLQDLNGTTTCFELEDTRSM